MAHSLRSIHASERREERDHYLRVGISAPKRGVDGLRPQRRIMPCRIYLMNDHTKVRPTSPFIVETGIVSLLFIFFALGAMSCQSQAIDSIGHSSLQESLGSNTVVTEPPEVAPNTAESIYPCDHEGAVLVLGASRAECEEWFRRCPDSEQLWWNAIPSAANCFIRYGAIWRLAELAPSDKLVDLLASLIKNGEDARKGTADVREMIILSRLDAVSCLGVINSKKSRALLTHMLTPLGEKEYTETWINLEVEGDSGRHVFLAEFRGEVSEGLIKTGMAECRKQVEKAHAAVESEYEQIRSEPRVADRPWEDVLKQSLLFRINDALAYALALGDVMDERGRDWVLQSQPFPGGELATLVEIKRMNYR